MRWGRWCGAACCHPCFGALAPNSPLRAPVQPVRRRNAQRCLLAFVAGRAVEARVGDLGFAFELAVVGRRRRRGQPLALLSDVAWAVVAFEAAVFLPRDQIAIDRVGDSGCGLALRERGGREDEGDARQALIEISPPLACYTRVREQL